MNPYCQYPNIIPPCFFPLPQPNYGGVISAWPHACVDPRNVPSTFAPISAFPIDQPTVMGAANVSPAPGTCPFQQQFSPEPPPPPAPAPATPGMPETSRIIPANAQFSPAGMQPRNPELPRNGMNNENNRRIAVEIGDLMDANLAGGTNSSSCTLILTETKAAMSLAVAGLPVIGRDKYGLYPLKRLPINVCKLSEKEDRQDEIIKVMKDDEIKNILNILNLNFDCTYETNAEMSTLRYGKVMLMIDRDEDGSHMKGLIINFFYRYWPALLMNNNFLMQFITPVVIVQHYCYDCRDKERSFYSIEDYEDWRKNYNFDNLTVKYYRSLEAFTPHEMMKYFSDIRKHCVFFRYEDDEDGEAIRIAFAKTNDRKRWLNNTMRESFTHYENLEEIRYKDFINKELLFYSDLQNMRSFPSVIDGLTRSQRKVLHACFKKYPLEEVGLLQLMGSVLEVSGYKQSSTALSQTIINMAQDFVGTNNINILMPIGQFGTRMYGGEDVGKAEYLRTKLNSIVKYIFPGLDFPILEYRKENDLSIEPVYYLPIIPMILVNGSDGIGTGWKTRIPKYNPEDIINNLFRMLRGLEPKEMNPYFKNFEGRMRKKVNNQFYSYGKFLVLEDNQIEITELPVGVWTIAYKNYVLNKLLKENMIVRYEEYHTDRRVNFRVTLPEMLEEKVLYEMFQLKQNENYYFVAFDSRPSVKNYESSIPILQEYFDVRLSAYEKRKMYMIKKLEFDLDMLYRAIHCKDENEWIKWSVQGEKYNFVYDARGVREKEKISLENIMKATREKFEQLREKLPKDIWREELEVLCKELGLVRTEGEILNDAVVISSMSNLNL